MLDSPDKITDSFWSLSVMMNISLGLFLHLKYVERCYGEKKQYSKIWKQSIRGNAFGDSVHFSSSS